MSQSDHLTKKSERLRSALAEIESHQNLKIIYEKQITQLKEQIKSMKTNRVGK